MLVLDSISSAELGSIKILGDANATGVAGCCRRMMLGMETSVFFRNNISHKGSYFSIKENRNRYFRKALVRKLVNAFVEKVVVFFTSRRKYFVLSGELEQ